MTLGIEKKLGVKVMGLGWDRIGTSKHHRIVREQEHINSYATVCSKAKLSKNNYLLQEGLKSFTSL